MLTDSFLFEQGFLGTQASLYMDLTTIYFGILPFLLAYSIKQAIRNELKNHVRSQIIIFFLTIIVVVIFEIGVRLEGGFIEYEQSSKVPFNLLFAFLTIHINVAIITILAWIYLLIATYNVYQRGGFTPSERKSHIKIGKYIFTAIVATSIMGIMMYFALFVYVK